VLSIVRGDSVIVPRGDDVIRAGDRLILLAVRKNIAKLEKALTVRVEQV
jgi:trk system potassium uptake protein TrkA